MGDYLLALAGDASERERLHRLQDYQDSATLRYLDAIGVADGWHCLDVGAGAGSIARWLSPRVGASGSVLATDINVELLADLDELNVEVRQHDIRAEALPENEFDLVHARALLEHLSERRDVLARLVAATRPGGWVVVGDVDFSTMRSRAPDAEFDRVKTAFEYVISTAGWEPALGARLPRMLAAAGLDDVEAEGWQTYQHGGAAMPALLAATFTRLADRLVDCVSADEFARILSRLNEARCGFFGPTIWTAWGRRSSA